MAFPAEGTQVAETSIPSSFPWSAEVMEVVHVAVLSLPPAAVLYVPLKPPVTVPHEPLCEYDELPLSRVRGVGKLHAVSLPYA